MSHDCGLCVTHSLQDTYLFIQAPQHRGKEAAGIAAIGTNRIDVIKWKGPVNTSSLTDLYEIFPGHDYYSQWRMSGKQQEEEKTGFWKMRSPCDNM